MSARVRAADVLFQFSTVHTSSLCKTSEAKKLKATSPETNPRGQLREVCKAQICPQTYVYRKIDR